MLSFTVVGVFWQSHHRAFGLLARSDERLLRRNLVFLFTIAIMPFPTALLSRYNGLSDRSADLHRRALPRGGPATAAIAPRSSRADRYLAADVDAAEAARILRRAWGVPRPRLSPSPWETFARSPFSIMALMVMPIAIRLAEAEPWRKHQPVRVGLNLGPRGLE